MAAGRPRTISLSPPQMIALGKEMIAWVKENDPIHLSKWYSIEKGYTDAQWRVMTEAAEFSPYYEQALKLVGYGYLERHSDIEPSLKQRWQRVYFKDLRRQEDEDAEKDAERKAKALKGEARAAEEEKQKVLKEVSRSRKTIK